MVGGARRPRRRPRATRPCWSPTSCRSGSRGCEAERRRTYFHDPRKRQCTLCSLTSFTFEGEHLVAIGFSEPAGDLIPLADRKANFSSGGDVADNAPPA